MPQGEGGVCYKQGIAVKQNFQQCDVTSKSFLVEDMGLRGLGLKLTGSRQKDFGDVEEESTGYFLMR